MKTVNLEKLSRLFFSMHDDTLEYFLSKEDYEDYYSCDLKNYCDFIKWFPVVFNLNSECIKGYSDNNNPINELYKNSLKFLILSNGFIKEDIYLPSLDNIGNDKEFRSEYNIFLIRVYQFLFQEQFFYESIDNFILI